MRTLLTAIALFASVTAIAPAFAETSSASAHDHSAMNHGTVMSMPMDHSSMNHGSQPASVGQTVNFTFIQSASGYDLISASAN
ncbi:MAG: hypothetical protein ACMZI0_15270 [Symbiopectobacterium sp.]|uniref:hypothetical protein n=1 Tax=Symbiopectobacterium sp. TaxID=2952789 RepID=UPI0039E85469